MGQGALLWSIKCLGRLESKGKQSGYAPMLFYACPQLRLYAYLPWENQTKSVSKCMLRLTEGVICAVPVSMPMNSYLAVRAPWQYCQGPV